MHTEYVYVYIHFCTVDASGLVKVNKPVNTFTVCLAKHIRTRGNKKRKRSFIGKVVLPLGRIIFSDYHY